MGCIKDRVYSEKISNLYDLKEKITAEIQKISSEHCANAMRSFFYRLNLCKQTKGKHFQVYM